MNYPTNLLRSLLMALAFMLVLPFAGSAGLLLGAEAAQAQTVSRIDVSGNTRVSDEVVISYLAVRVGGQATQARITQSTQSLLASGLFSSANVRFGGGVLQVTVSENRIVGSVLFEGNVRFSDKQLLAMVEIANRGVFTEQAAETDVQSIRLAYQEQGYDDIAVSYRAEPVDGRIRVVYVVKEGTRAAVKAINFTGNNNVNSGQLKSVIRTKETHLLSWLLRDDAYDDQKLAIDRELIRQYYFDHGYPDAQVLSAVADFDAANNAYFINFTISEGEYYRFGDIAVETSINSLDTAPLTGAIDTYRGDRYSNRKLQQSAEEIAVRATEQGYAFADVRPRIDRDIANRTFNVTYLVDEGARIYVQRINITGNEKTRDFVIRRELGFAEGDPFNRSIISRGKRAVEDLGYFATVDISTAPGSAADQVVININVAEKSTGDYGATIGYASDQGVLGELSLTERNFLGRGQFLRVAVGASQTGRTFDFSFTEPRFMGLKISSGLDLYKRITDETAATFYGTDSTGGQLRVGVPITDEVSTTLFVGLNTTTYADGNADSGLVVNGQTRNSLFAGYTLVYNGVDDVKRPTTGLYATFTQKYVGWDNNYLQSEAKARYFLPIMEDTGFVASLRGQAGVINSFSGAGVHPTETFRLGPTLVRGFEGGGMGPRLASGEGLGATYYAGLSAEVQFPIPVLPESYGLSGAIWADMGYVGAESAGGPAAATGVSQPVRASVGASIIWDSPFGPLRTDFAHVLQKDPADRTQWFQLTLKSLL